MNTSSVVPKSYKGPSTIKRAIFGPGMLLQHEDLEQLNLYTRDLSRLLFRSFFGCGVVCGLKVSAQDKCGKTSVTVEAGVALNCLGDPIYVPKDVEFDATDGCDPAPPALYVWLCSCPKCCAPRTPSCGCDEGGGTPACTREVDWYEIYVGKEKPDCACGCDLPKPAGDTTPPTDTTGEQVPDAPALMGATAPGSTATKPDDHPCRCADPGPKSCYYEHYQGKCGCKCEDSNCVVLAKLTHDDNKKWTTDYTVRRFIRPVLVRDPLAYPPPAADATTADATTAGSTTAGSTAKIRLGPTPAKPKKTPSVKKSKP